MFSKKADYVVFSDSATMKNKQDPANLFTGFVIVNPRYIPKMKADKNMQRSMLIGSSIYNSQNPPVIDGHVLSNVGLPVMQALAAKEALSYLYHTCEDQPEKLCIDLRFDCGEVSDLMRKKAYKMLSDISDRDTKIAWEDFLWYKDQFKNVQGSLIPKYENIAHNTCAIAIASEIERIKGRHARNCQPIKGRMKRKTEMIWPRDFGNVYDGLLERASRSESAQKLRELYLIESYQG